ncbi:hypothetical protein CEUSTIGMA_g13269.t1 [Chlamydomonas eustigma]|uniref:Uncharacterized protein n=1 Tax=Chlamydomonas eustigma TaxID=1157962 RepID=A0A250XS22_9CHLO|nr:hypothetical protein CEUSTIGMA_g13269.t1 [Chlamydomonas eustigma]|eukprot:GAX85854.1 hypothetical protein CEUSTIGMA_g13269.t1 [Chlamydomonas eustigma]
MYISPFASHIINVETAAQMIHVDFRHQNTQDRQLEATTSFECDMLQQLINACKIGEAEYIIELVNTSQCDVNMKDPHTGRSAMHVACYHDQSGALRSLLSLGASFHQLDHSGATPVHVAAAHGLECLKLLLQDYHADGCARDGAGRTPLSHAASSGNLEAISVLLTHPSCGPGAVAIPDASGSLPIHQAASCGQAQVLKLLIHPLHGIGPDCEEEAPAPRRRSPLHLAAQMGHNAAVETLLALGGNPGVLDAQDASPCHVAAENGHLGVLQMLYQAGATCQSTDRDGWLPLQLAASQGHTNCVDFLLSACGSNVNEVNMISARNRGWTSLHCATKQKDVQMVLHLLACGADPTLR